MRDVKQHLACMGIRVHENKGYVSRRTNGKQLRPYCCPALSCKGRADTVVQLY